MKYKVVPAVALILAACSQQPSAQANDSARELKSKIAHQNAEVLVTLSDGKALALSISGELVNEIRADISSSEDRHLSMQQANYAANAANYVATASGVEARMNSENRMKQDKVASLRRELAVLKASAPLLVLEEKFDNDEKIAKAGGHSLDLTQSLKRLQVIIIESRKTLDKFEKFAPHSKQAILQKRSELNAFASRLNNKAAKYTRITGGRT